LIADTELFTKSFNQLVNLLTERYGAEKIVSFKKNYPPNKFIDFIDELVQVTNKVGAEGRYNFECQIAFADRVLTHLSQLRNFTVKQSEFWQDLEVVEGTIFKRNIALREKIKLTY
jgi:hypothetical protein